MAEWPNPVPTIPLLRLRYPKFDGDAAPIPPSAIFAWCTIAAPIWFEIVIPQMDRLVLKVLRTFNLSFLPYESVTSLQTERQAVERIILRASLILGHLFLLWPLLSMSLLLVTEVILWMTGLNALQYAAHLGVLPESFMVFNLIFYCGDIGNVAFMLEETRQIDLVNLTKKLWRDREGKRCSLGYSRYGARVRFSSEPESWLRGRGSSTIDHPYAYIRRSVLNLIVSTSAFLAGRSSSMTCIRLDGIWGSREPIHGLGLPLFTNVLILAHELVSYWERRGAKKRSHEFIRPPRMCNRVLKERVIYLSNFGEERLLAKMQKLEDELLWGCPWRPSVEQLRYWL